MTTNTGSGEKHANPTPEAAALEQIQTETGTTNGDVSKVYLYHAQLRRADLRFMRFEEMHKRKDSCKKPQHDAKKM